MAITDSTRDKDTGKMSNQNLDDLIEASNQASTSRNATARAEQENAVAHEKKKRNTIIAGSVAGGLLVLGGIGYAVFGHGNNNTATNTPTPVNTVAVTGSSDPSVLSTPDDAQTPFWTLPGKQYPVQVPSWTKTSYTQQGFFKNSIVTSSGKLNPNAPESKVIATYSDTEMSSASNRLPSQQAGYTSDPTKKTLANGNPNPMYTSLTAEDYQAEVGTILTRLTNPDFGDWASYEYSQNHAEQTFNPVVFKDMMTPQNYALGLSEKPKDWAPIYADWNENDYGMAGQFLPDYGPRWVGVIQSTQSKWSQDSQTGLYTINMTVNIDYVAWSNDQTKLEKSAILTLELVSNDGQYANNGSQYKVLVNKAKLEVK